MPSIASLLKSEIVRLARKELKRELVPLRQQIASQRKALSSLRLQLAEAQRHAKRGRRVEHESASSTAERAVQRFSVKGLKSTRAKLGLSAADFGRLAGVTGTTVYNWEGGKARPQRAQLEALGTLRGLGKRAAQAKLDEMR